MRAESQPPRQRLRLGPVAEPATRQAEVQFACLSWSGLFRSYRRRRCLDRSGRPEFLTIELDSADLERALQQ